MSYKSLTFWSENLQKEIYDIWQDKFSFWKPGFKVFYSSVISEPELMIISYQPGGNETHFINEDKESFEKGDFSVKGNAFLERDYVMARNIRKFFDFDGGLRLLKSSVIFPMIFFRAPDVITWRQIPKKTRIEMEKVCFSKVIEIIEQTRPKKILVLGIGTYGELIRFLGVPKNETVVYTRRNGKEKMAIASDIKDIQILSITHPSGARISKNDNQQLQRILKNWSLH